MENRFCPTNFGIGPPNLVLSPPIWYLQIISVGYLPPIFSLSDLAQWMTIVNFALYKAGATTFLEKGWMTAHLYISLAPFVSLIIQVDKFKQTRPLVLIALIPHMDIQI